MDKEVLKRIKIISIPILVFLTLAFSLSLYKRSVYKPPQPVLNIRGELIDSFILVDSVFLVNFYQVLPEYALEKIVMQFEPSIEFDVTWEQNSIATITPVLGLEAGQEYVLNVIYKGEVLATKKYSVNTYNLEELQEQASIQSREDINFAESASDLRVEFSWYDEIPVITDEFVIVYDYELESFRIRLLTPEDPTSSQAKDYLQKALERMSLISTIPEDFEYYVLFQDSWTQYSSEDIN